MVFGGKVAVAIIPLSRPGSFSTAFHSAKNKGTTSCRRCGKSEIRKGSAWKVRARRSALRGADACALRESSYLRYSSVTPLFALTPLAIRATVSLRLKEILCHLFEPFSILLIKFIPGIFVPDLDTVDHADDDDVALDLRKFLKIWGDGYPSL